MRSRLLHGYAVSVAAATAVLIFAGGMVTSTGSGLSVPDWPNTYGWFMFSFPLEKMVGGIFYEHTHRLIASTVGALIVGLAIWLRASEPRAWVRRLGWFALAAVVVQGLLGGITVLWYLPEPVSIAHAGLAQVVFCLTCTIALATSRAWSAGYPTAAGPSPDDRLLQRTALVTTVFVYLQILAGATMRHNEAGLAIPDFPLAFGQLIPPQWDLKIGLHFSHRLGALVVSALILATTAHVFYHHPRRPELRRCAILLLVVLATQVTLGALTVLSGLHHIINSMHVITGGLVLVTSLVLTLRAHRARFGDLDARQPRTGHTSPVAPVVATRHVRPLPGS